jgi:serine/threonine protein kinase
VPCYGLSQNPQTKDYLMIMQYIPEGNLRQYLQKNYAELNFIGKFSRLVHLAQGLKDIHQKNLIHRDFHPGNILNSDIHSFITDLGLCQPANEINQEKIYGVLPYLAPEVLGKKKYTLAADIYSFGIVAYELFSGIPLYHDCAHDRTLAMEVCQGRRPNFIKFKVKIPLLLENLIKRC